MKKAGISRPSGTAAHHILPPGHSQAKALMARLEREFDIDRNSPVNGVFLPTREAAENVAGSPHIGGHANSYVADVVARLTVAADTGDRTLVYKAFAEIKGELIESNLLINSAKR